MEQLHFWILISLNDGDMNYIEKKVKFSEDTFLHSNNDQVSKVRLTSIVERALYRFRCCNNRIAIWSASISPRTEWQRNLDK